LFTILAGLPTGFYSRILNYRDDIQLPLISIPKITSKAVSGTKVNIVKGEGKVIPLQARCGPEGG